MARLEVDVFLVVSFCWLTGTTEDKTGIDEETGV